MKRADSLLAPLIKNLGIEDAVRLGRIKREWARIFEMPVSLHTSPANLSEGELLINVDSPVWMQQLNFFKTEIIEKLKPFGIKSVKLKIGRVLIKKEEKAGIAKKRNLTAGENAYIEEVVSSVKDSEMKDMIKHAIAKSILRGKN